MLKIEVAYVVSVLDCKPISECCSMNKKKE